MRKKIHRRLLSCLLAVALALSLLPPVTARAAETAAVTGSVSVTLRIDYDQSLTELQERQIQAQILHNGTVLGTAALAEPGVQSLTGGYEAVVSSRDKNGAETNGGWPGYLDMTVDGLPQGTYTVRLTGRGYVTHSEEFTMKDFARHVIMGTGDSTFTLGDVNDDGRVDEKDRDSLSRALGSQNDADIERYDLSGDGTIDIVDLAYVNRQLEASGGAQLLQTAMLAPPVDTEQTEKELKACGTTVSGAALSSLFVDDGQSVLFSDTGSGPIVVPLSLEETVEMEEMQIVTPSGDSTIRSGEVVVEDGGGNETRVLFDTTLPENTHAISRTPGSSVITIHLGARIAVKKITITVEKTESGYAAMESIRFLQDIVPENPAPLNSIVKNLTAKAGSKQVDLTWDELPNVSGYKVLYWPQSSPSSTKELRTEVTTAQIAALDNLKTYVFTVTPIDGDWEGKPCDPVTAIPQPAKAPAKTDMVQVTEMDGALTVSWKAAEDATYFEVYYQEKDGSQWQQAGGQLVQTRTVIDNLTNDTTYSVYVLAGNDRGKGPRSDIAEGTPKAVKYERPEGIPTSGILDSSKIESVKLADPNNYSRDAYTHTKPFSVQNVIDNDYSTHWTARDWSHNEHVEVTFKTPVDLTGVIWVPRLDGAYPTYLRAYSIQVWYDGEDLSKAGHLLAPHPNMGGVDRGALGNDSDMQTWPAVQGNPSVSKFAILPMGTTENIKKISVAVEQRAYYLVSLSELLFLEYDPNHDLPGDIDRLYANSLHTELAPNVTQSDIDTLRTRLAGEERTYCLYPAALEDDLKLAEELLSSQKSSGVLLNGLDSRDASGGSDLQPLGVTAKAQQEITIYASGIPEGQTVTVYATQFNSEVTGWKGSIGTLTNGRNVMKVPRLTSTADKDKGGSLYASYHGADADQISLHIRRAIDIPMLDLSDWYTQTESERKAAIGAYADELDAYLEQYTFGSEQNDCRNVTEIATPVVLLSLPAKAVRNALGSGTREEQIHTIYRTVQAWEDVMHICKITHGIDGTYEKNTMTARQNIRCMTMFQGAFMYAAGNHIGIGYGSCGGMVTGRPIRELPEGASVNGLFGWGIAHEIGHNMDMLGKAEITNNIYSLMVQTYDGKQNTLPSRLENSGKYSAIFTKTAQQHTGASNDVFVQLGMYWQLHLAYDDAAQEPLHFYNAFSKAWQAGTYTEGASSYDEKVALTASGVAGKNLTEFFTRWGMMLSDQVKEKLKTYPAEERAIWYFSDASRRDMLQGTAPSTGQAAASVQKQADSHNTVVLTIDASGITGSVQGYEISRNGTSIAFVMADAAKKTAAYTDTIGSGNHRDYEYTVTAYDLQGRKIGGTVQAGEVRIAYDSVVSEDEYEISRRGEAVEITLKKETAVSGLKLNGVIPQSGSYTVTITDADGRNTTARTGTWGSTNNQAVDDKDSYVTYFKVPGADQGNASETRIWTYDAKTVVITGIPEQTDLKKVQLIRYAGDDVAFLDGATMGLLTEDYKCDEDNILPAGTLVIIGTYRGDPVYNTFVIEGEFTGTVMTEAGGITEADPVRRPLDGKGYLFAAMPAFGDMCDISDGIFLFVPNVQREAELQNMEQSGTHCTVTNLLPSRIRVNFYRTDDPNSADSKRLTAQSMWIECPGGTDLPTVVIQEGVE